MGQMLLYVELVGDIRSLHIHGLLQINKIFISNTN